MNKVPSNILDRPLGGRGARSSADASVSQSAFAYLYSELIQYHQSRAAGMPELERRLESAGYGVGLRMLELLSFRARETKRETRVMSILKFVSGDVWKSLFGKPASLESSIDHSDEFMVIDYEPLTSTYVSARSASVDSFLSGIIAGVLDAAGFSARVTAHSVTLGEGEASHAASSAAAGNNTNPSLPPRRNKAVFLVKFNPDVLKRDAVFDRLKRDGI